MTAILLGMLAASVSVLGDVSIALQHSTYAEGDVVTAIVYGEGQVLIENDVAKMSQVVNVSGSALVELGRVDEPGFYAIRASTTHQSALVTFVAMPKEADYQLHAASATGPASDDALVNRFLRGLTMERLKIAASNVFLTWAAHNSVGLSATATICIVPGGQSACIIGSSQHAIDLSVAILVETTELMARDGEITATDKSLIQSMLKGGNAALGIALAKGKFDTFLQTIGAAADFTIDSEAGKLGAKFTIDEAKKVKIILDITGK